MQQSHDSPLPPGGEPVGVVRWEAWSPLEVAARLRGVDAPWAFAAGWALDLFRETSTRNHQDIEICVPAQSFGLIRAALAPYEFEIVGDGRRWPISDQQALAAMHQTWLRDPESGIYRLDVFREPHDGATWIYRRDRTLRRPYAEIVRRTRDGLPYLAPEVVLLFKAEADRPKDEQDFASVLPLLDAASVRWLADLLARIHPGHRWIGLIAAFGR